MYRRRENRLQGPRGAVVSVGQNLQLARLGDMGDVSKFLFDPAYTHLLQTLRSFGETAVEDAQDHMARLKYKRGFVNPEELLKYTESPTAHLTLCAFQNYLVGCFVISKYKKSSVESEEDCDLLQDGIHGYALGLIQAQYMGNQFPIQQKNLSLILDGYINCRPHDTLAEFLKVVFQYLGKGDSTKSDFEQSKDKIRALEMLAYKLSHYKGNDTEMVILSAVLHLLGSLYTVTEQSIRAIDAFSQCYQLNENDIDALYALGFHYVHDQPRKALDMLERYLQLAPPCHEKYPEAHYLLGMYHVLHGEDLHQAKHFYNLGLKAESLRLPFNPPTDFQYKNVLESVVLMINLKGFQNKRITAKK